MFICMEYSYISSLLEHLLFISHMLYDFIKVSIPSRLIYHVHYKDMENKVNSLAIPYKINQC